MCLKMAMKKIVLLLLAVMLLTACGEDKENDQGAVYVNITAEEPSGSVRTDAGKPELSLVTMTAAIPKRKMFLPRPRRNAW